MRIEPRNRRLAGGLLFVLAIPASAAGTTVYAAPNATGAQAGTQAQPIASLAAAIAKVVAAGGGEVHAVEGTYQVSTPLPLHAGVAIRGGYAPDFSRVKGRSAVTIAAGAGPMLIHVQAPEAANTHGASELSDLILHLPDQHAVPGGTSEGIAVAAGARLRLSNVTFEGGIGGGGKEGAPGAPGQGICTGGGAGGQTVKLPGSDGYVNPRGSDIPGSPYCNSLPGQPGAPTRAPSGKSSTQPGASGRVACDWNSDGQVTNGADGGSGEPGQSGAGLPPMGEGAWQWQHGMPVWNAPTARQASKGGDGGAGAGGGGGGSKRQGWFWCDARTLLGTPGSSGGGGGCGGQGGWDGQAGGHVWGIVLGDRAVLEVDQVHFQLGQAGNGGHGGRGGAGAAGDGIGALPPAPARDKCAANSIVPGRGGRGGAGASGGFGAGGAGGNGGSVVAVVRANSSRVMHQGAWRIAPTSKAGEGGAGGLSAETQQTGAPGAPGRVRVELVVTAPGT